MLNYLVTLLVAAVVFACNQKPAASNKATDAPSEKWQQVWNDEFDYTGLPDSTKWDYDVGGHGWGNHERQYYTKADTHNVRVHDGSLFITAHKEKRDSNTWTSARLITKKKGDWRYGKILVRAKLPDGKGMWPAIWMLPTDWEYGGWPASGEIDIMENVGYMPDSVFCSVHTQSFNHSIHTQKTKGISLPDNRTQFHEYGIEWNAKEIIFLTDGKPVFSFQNTGKGSAEWPFDKRFHLLLNIAFGGDWGGSRGIDETLTQGTMEVDYVRVYQLGE